MPLSQLIDKLPSWQAAGCNGGKVDSAKTCTLSVHYSDSTLKAAGGLPMYYVESTFDPLQSLQSLF